MQYAWAAPGVYPVTLTVTDDSAPPPRRPRRTTIDVTVSAAPVADAGPDQSVAVSEVAFDGGGSHDPDGAHHRLGLELRRRRRPRAGAASATPTPAPAPTRWRSSSATTAARRSTSRRDTTTVRVNAAPIADAGPDLVAAPGEEVVLDGSGSVDPDDAVASWTERTVSEQDRHEHG